MGASSVSLGLVAGLLGLALSSAALAIQAPPVAAHDDITVIGKHLGKPCGDGDKECILAVAKQVWTHYPSQIKFYCQSSRTQRFMQRALVQQLGLSSSYSSHSSDSSSVSDDLPDALATVCNYRDPHEHQIASNWVPWSSVPSDADLVAAYPQKAKVDSGDARINCKVEDNGNLEDCHLSDEVPDEQGFGKAAMNLSGKFHVNKLVAAKRRDEALWVDVAIHFSRAGDASCVVEGPDWTLLPDPNRIAALYPAEAARAGVPSGVGKVDCRIADDGGLGDCRLVDEQPAELGFGAAALAVAPQLRANLWTRTGQRAVGAHVVVPLRFDAPTTGDAPKAPAGE